MPLYEYHCPDCGKDYDEFRAIEKRDEPKDCPSCGGKKPERKLSLFASAISSSLGMVGGAASCGGSGGFT